jgi:DnaJ-class molecular chaperone
VFARVGSNPTGVVFRFLIPRLNPHSIGHFVDFQNMSQQVDYYEVLGIARGASQDEIKKAYRRLAIQHHPDKNPGNEEAASIKFKEIAAAYEILSNPDKRSHYDRFGNAPGTGTGGFGGPGGFNMNEVDPFEIFQAFFGGPGMQADLFEQMGFGGAGVHFNTFGGPGIRFRMGGNRVPTSHSARTVSVQVSLEDLYKGGKKRVNNEEIEIRPGLQNGTRIKGSKGDYIVREIAHNIYGRSGDHLEYTAVIPFLEWLLFGKSNFQFKHLDGSSLTVNLRPFTQTLLKPSAIIKGKGMPVTGSVFGDLVVYSSFLAKKDSESAKAMLKSIGTVIMVILVMTNPSLIFLLLLLRPLFS